MSVDPKLFPVLESCYRRLDSVAARAFRLLGSGPYPPLPLGAIAALAGLDPGDARGVVETLRRYFLVKTDGVGRVHLHDQLGAYAAAQVPPEELTDARRRLIRWYAATAAAAGNALAYDWAGPAVAVEHAGIRPASFGADQPNLALDWFKEELRTALVLLRDFGHIEPEAWKLCYHSLPSLFLIKPAKESLEFVRLGLEIAQQLPDPLAQARSLHGFAWVQYERERYGEALRYLEQARVLDEGIDDDRGYAWIMFESGRSLAGDGDYAAGYDHLQFALRHFRASDCPFGVSIVLSKTAGVLNRLQRPEEALAAAREGLAVARELGNVPLQALAHHELGDLHHRQRNYLAAVGEFDTALALRREVGELWGLAETLFRLGLAFAALEERHRARDLYVESHAIFAELHDHRTSAVELALTSLDVAPRPRR